MYLSPPTFREYLTTPYSYKHSRCTLVSSSRHPSTIPTSALFRLSTSTSHRPSVPTSFRPSIPTSTISALRHQPLLFPAFRLQPLIDLRHQPLSDLRYQPLSDLRRYQPLLSSAFRLQPLIALRLEPLLSANMKSALQALLALSLAIGIQAGCIGDWRKYQLTWPEAKIKANYNPLETCFRIDPCCSSDFSCQDEPNGGTEPWCAKY
jgi:hypothetical protein